MDTGILDYLTRFISPRRSKLFDKVLDMRTRYITIVLEDIYQSNNASAVLRTCDCFGIQDVFIIENRNPYDLNTEVSMGAEKWLNLHKFNSEQNNSLQALTALKNDGYRIIATSPHENNIPLPEFELNKGKVALFFGTELTGLSDIILDNADEYLKIPMYGFTESYNISVSAALILQNLVTRLHQSKINWKLSTEDKNRIKLDWLRQSIKKVELIEKKYLENRGKIN